MAFSKIFIEIYRLILLRNTDTTFWIKRIKNRPSSDVVLSLTILPSRLKGFKPTLNSLTDQNTLPKKIIINYPTSFLRDKSDIKIPNFVKNHPLVEINKIENDLGPATKLLPTLKKYTDSPDQLIVVVDDDQIYSKSLVESYSTYREELGDVAMTVSGWSVPKSYNHADRTQVYGAIVRIYRRDNAIKTPQRVDCLQGASSYAVMPKLFTSEVFNYENAPNEAFYVDDIWFSGHLAVAKSPVYVIPLSCRFGRFVSVRQQNDISLSKAVNSNHQNNNILYQYFEKHWHSLNILK